jgi:hypothetical protein
MSTGAPHKKFEETTHSSNKEDKKDNNISSWKYLIIIIFIIVLVFLAGMWGVKNAQKKTIEENTLTYNSYVFRLLEDKAWYVDLAIKGKLYTIPFYYTPDKVEYVNVTNESVNAIALFSKYNPGGKVYMAIDPNELSTIVIAGVEVARILGENYDMYNFKVESAFFKLPYENYTGHPVVNCDNATQNTMVIMFAVGEKDRVRAIGNCILLESESLNNSIKVADAFSYKILRIIP